MVNILGASLAMIALVLILLGAFFAIVAPDDGQRGMFVFFSSTDIGVSRRIAQTISTIGPFNLAGG